MTKLAKVGPREYRVAERKGWRIWQADANGPAWTINRWWYAEGPGDRFLEAPTLSALRAELADTLRPW